MDQLVEHGQSVIEKGSKSFAAAARLFDPDTRAGAYLLYAWCRHCDDVIDDGVRRLPAEWHGHELSFMTGPAQRLAKALSVKFSATGNEGRMRVRDDNTHGVYGRRHRMA